MLHGFITKQNVGPRNYFSFANKPRCAAFFCGGPFLLDPGVRLRPQLGLNQRLNVNRVKGVGNWEMCTWQWRIVDEALVEIDA